ncbi:hypothetical protein [Azospirillum sp. sgz301742]
MDENVDEIVVEIARETLKGDIRDFLLDRLKHDKSPLPWDAQPEHVQRETIQAAERAAERLIEKVAQVVRGEGRIVVEMALEYFVVKDGVRATLTAPKTLDLLAQLSAAQGSTVSLVFVSTEHVQGQRKPRFAKPDQATFLDEDTGQEFPAPTEEPPPPIEEPPSEDPPATEPPAEEPKQEGPKDEPEVARAKRRKRS